MIRAMLEERDTTVISSLPSSSSQNVKRSLPPSRLSEVAGLPGQVFSVPVLCWRGGEEGGAWRHAGRGNRLLSRCHVVPKKAGSEGLPPRWRKLWEASSSPEFESLLQGQEERGREGGWCGGVEKEVPGVFHVPAFPCLSCLPVSRPPGLRVCAAHAFHAACHGVPACLGNGMPMPGHAGGMAGMQCKLGNTLGGAGVLLLLGDFPSKATTPCPLGVLSVFPTTAKCHAVPI